MNKTKPPPAYPVDRILFVAKRHKKPSPRDLLMVLLLTAAAIAFAGTVATIATALLMFFSKGQQP